MNTSRRWRLSAKTLCCVLLLGSLTCHGKGALAVYEQLRSLSVEELMHVQYYSNGFDLVRVVSSTSEHSALGRLVTKNGQVYEVIRFKKGTPGIATKVSEDRHSLWVSFEPQCSVEFRANTAENLLGPFGVAIHLVAASDQGFQMSVPQVSYCGSEYRPAPSPWNDVRLPLGLPGTPDMSCKTSDPMSQCASKYPLHLVVDLEHLQHITKNQRVAPGRTVKK